MQDSWEFHSFDDIRRFWTDVRSITSRAEGREHYHEEQYSLRLYLFVRGGHALLSFPIKVEQGESPDFMLTWPSGERRGLEVTRATTKDLQKTMTEMDKEFLRREAKAKAAGVEVLPLPADEGVILMPRAVAEPVCIGQEPLGLWVMRASLGGVTRC